MDRRLLFVPLLLAGLLAGGASAQLEQGYGSADETRSAMERALQDQRAAQVRAQGLELAASRAGAAVDKTAREAAALAARIQESEAGIAAAEARLALIDGQRRVLATQLAKRQKPVVRLTAALQRFSRRPLALSVMRPGSVKEMVYLRAMLSTTVPEVQRRTAALRSEIERGEALQREARQALAALRSGEKQLTDRRRQLAALETRQRLASRQVSGEAAREAERALALA
jgi:septal ring factor EnvC (AmiA/AmiB activator)